MAMRVVAIAAPDARKKHRIINWLALRWAGDVPPAGG